MKIVISFEETGLLIQAVSQENFKMVDFFSMLLGTLGASLLENLLTGKGVIRAGEETIRDGQRFQCYTTL